MRYPATPGAKMRRPQLYSVYHTNGDTDPFFFEGPASLEKLQEVVGGPIEFVRLPDSAYTACVNEEGKLKGLKPNRSYPMFCGVVILGVMHKGVYMGSHFKPPKPKRKVMEEEEAL